MSDTTFRFGRAEVRPLQRQLLVDGVAAPVGGRAFDLLLALIERRGGLASKNDLLDAVWPGLVVEENNLTVQISALRKLLGASVIATIPGRGYRFTAAVEGLDPANGAATSERSSPQTSDSNAIPGNLPDTLPALYGREAEVRVVVELLDRHRLVSLVGAGGIGKTRLAQAAAHALRQHWPDGAWLVELAALSDPLLVPAAVAQTLGLRLTGVRPALDELMGALRAQTLLLVLDNCEHLLDSVTALARAIAASAPPIHLLITSQEPLRLADEQQFRVAPLATPEGGAPDDARSFGAVALFEARVRAIDRGFALGPQNLDAAIEICRRLDGLPLAIELAAARVPLLGVQGVRRRLDERFELLSGGLRAVLRRHQTLRAALEWSHGLLNDEEQAVFRALGVFSGGFTLELAQAVTAGETDRGGWAAVEGLAALADKSLVVTSGGDLPRYHLLETTRAYALEQLAVAGETASALKRHAFAVHAVFRRLCRSLDEGEMTSVELADALVPELDNLRAAYRWARGPAGDLSISVELAASATALHEFGAEAAAWLRELEPGLLQCTSLEVVAAFWHSMARVGIRGFIPMPVQAESAERAAALYEQLGMPKRRYSCLMLAAYYRSDLRQVAESQVLIEQAGQLLQPHWPAPLRADLPGATAHALFTRGFATEDALRFAAEQINLLVECGDWRREIGARNSLADATWALGRVDEALHQFSANATRLRALAPDPRLMSYALGNLLGTLSELGQTDKALAVAREALPFMRRCGLLRFFADNFAQVLIAQTQPAAAARLIGVSDAYFASMATPRQPNEQRLMDKSRATLQSILEPTTLRAFLDEGSALDEQAVHALLTAALGLQVTDWRHPVSTRTAVDSRRPA